MQPENINLYVYWPILVCWLFNFVLLYFLLVCSGCYLNVSGFCSYFCFVLFCFTLFHFVLNVRLGLVGLVWFGLPIKGCFGWQNEKQMHLDKGWHYSNIFDKHVNSFNMTWVWMIWMMYNATNCTENYLHIHIKPHLNVLCI